MVDPTTNSLLLLYDDAQSIYERSKARQSSFKSVGVQAQRRTTILKINYRNTRQILQMANRVAADLLTPEDKDDDGIPLVRPVSCGRDGEAPLIIRLPSPRDEYDKIAELMQSGVDPLPWTCIGLILKPFRVLSGRARRHLQQHQTALRCSFQSSGVRGSPDRCAGAGGCTSLQSR